MLTYQRYSMAFDTPGARARFYERAARNGVTAGTAMKHVLASNLGIWGDTHSLKQDAAEIIRFEMMSWATNNGETPLTIPAEIIAQSPRFTEAFNACVAPNRNEMDRFVKSRFQDESQEPGTPYEKFLGEEFVFELYYALVKIDKQYERAERRHSEELATMDFDEE